MTTPSNAIDLVCAYFSSYNPSILHIHQPLELVIIRIARVKSVIILYFVTIMTFAVECASAAANAVNLLSFWLFRSVSRFGLDSCQKWNTERESMERRACVFRSIRITRTSHISQLICTECNNSPNMNKCFDENPLLSFLVMPTVVSLVECSLSRYTARPFPFSFKSPSLM